MCQFGPVWSHYNTAMTKDSLDGGTACWHPQHAQGEVIEGRQVYFLTQPEWETRVHVLRAISVVESRKLEILGVLKNDLINGINVAYVNITPLRDFDIQKCVQKYIQTQYLNLIRPILIFKVAISKETLRNTGQYNATSKLKSVLNIF